MKPVIIYISGAHQHSGKTVTSIGLLSLLSKIYPSEELGYIKPVGQQVIKLDDGTTIDKDAQIIDKFSQIPALDLKIISPVQFPSTFTREYLDSGMQETLTQNLSDSIKNALSFLKNKKYIIAEGTGHPGVGSIVGLSNAVVSNMIGADILYISGGGVGRAIDKMEVDLSYFRHMGSRLRGIIFNKVIEDKIPTMKKYITEDLVNKRFRSQPDLPVSILGYLPKVRTILNPSMNLLRKRFTNHKIIGNIEDSLWHKPVNNIKILSLVSEVMDLDELIDPGDIVLIAIMSRNRRSRILKYAAKMKGRLGGLILTSAKMYSLSSEIEEMILDVGIPAFVVEEDTAGAEEILLDGYANTKL
ncbi:MAG: AAA family ATPase, partial [Spirochaetales bacterium]|nr:AAA family ATPase [Spirochaetales bacterium]